MKTTKLLYLIPAALGFSMAGAFAQSVASPPIGFNKVVLKGGSDTLISLPFHQKPAFTGLVGTVTDLSGNSVSAGEDVEITVSGTPGPEWTPTGFIGSHYVRITSGENDGYAYEILDNGAGSIQLNGNGGDLSGILGTDTFSVIPHATLDTVFAEPAPAGVVYESTNPISVDGTEVLIRDNETMALNKATSASFFYYNGAWRKRGEAFTADFGAEVLRPSTHFIVRHKAGVDDTQICADGRVPLSKNVIQIDVDAAGNDNFISVDRPIPVLLNDFGSNLISDNIFAPSINPISVDGDELFVYDNSIAVQNKSANSSYYYYNGAWRLRGGSFAVDVGADPNHALKPGEAVVVRKKADTAATLFLVNEPTY